MEDFQDSDGRETRPFVTATINVTCDYSELTP